MKEYSEHRNHKGDLHRVVLPAIDFPHCQEWWINGKRHRDCKPAVIEIYPDGSIKKEEWWFSGKLHRIDGPAIIEYGRDGEHYVRMWLVEGRLHNDCNPAVLYGDGKQMWYWEGKRHRDDGNPAIINGPNDYEYWFYGKKVEKDSYEFKQGMRKSRKRKLERVKGNGQ